MNDCPVKYALDLLSGKWKLRILWELSQDVYKRQMLSRRERSFTKFK